MCRSCGQDPTCVGGGHMIKAGLNFCAQLLDRRDSFQAKRPDVAGEVFGCFQGDVFKCGRVVKAGI